MDWKEVQIEFIFDGSTLGGKQLVTFEELYDMTNPEEPKRFLLMVFQPVQETHEVYIYR